VNSFMRLDYRLYC